MSSKIHSQGLTPDSRSVSSKNSKESVVSAEEYGDILIYLFQGKSWTVYNYNTGSSAKISDLVIKFKKKILTKKVYQIRF